MNKINLRRERNLAIRLAFESQMKMDAARESEMWWKRRFWFMAGVSGVLLLIVIARWP